MKALLLALVSMFMIQTAFAKTPELSACSQKTLTNLHESIAEQKKDFPNVKYMRNEKYEIVGFFTWADDNDSTFFSEICESMWIDEDITAADKWYYWQNEGEEKTLRTSVLRFSDL